MCIRDSTSGNQKAAKIVRYCVFGTVGVYGALAVLTCREDLFALAQGGSFEPLLASGAAFFGAMPGLLFPVTGWSAGLVGSIFSGDWTLAEMCIRDRSTGCSGFRAWRRKLSTASQSSISPRSS